MSLQPDKEEERRQQLLKVNIIMICADLLIVAVLSSILNIIPKPLGLAIVTIPVVIFAVSSLDARRSGNLGRGTLLSKLGFLGLGSAIFMIVFGIL